MGAGRMIVHLTAQLRAGPGELALAMLFGAQARRWFDPAERADAERSVEMKKCPYCAEWIRREAIKCRYCGLAVAVA